MMIKFLKYLTIKNRANKLGQRVINGRSPHYWNKADNRNLIRINRICAGLKPFNYTLQPRKVRDVFECQISLFKFGNIRQEPQLCDSIRDLIAFNKIMI